MAFLNPILLLGLLGIAVPVLIHLRNRRRVVRLRWGAMRFLRVAIERNEKRMRMEDLLLLLLRCLLVGLIALALARPAFKGGAGLAGMFARQKVVGVVVVDVSGSMASTDGVKSRVELAKEAAEQIVAGMPAGSRMALWTASDGVGGVEKLIDEPTNDLGLVRKMIGEIKGTDRGTQLAGTLLEAESVLKTAAGSERKEVYLVTDGQRRGVDVGAMTQALKEGEAVHATMLLVGSPVRGNVGISDLRASTGIVTVGRQVRYVATVTNYGEREVRDVRVVLKVDADAGHDVPAGDEGRVDVIGAGESKTVSLYGRFAAAGMHSVRAEIAAVGSGLESAGGSYLSDDERTVVSRVVDRVKVLLVDGDPGREAREGQAFYLRQALMPMAGSEEGFVKVDVVAGVDVDSKEGLRLDDYDAVVLAGVTDVSPAFADTLLAYVNRGGGMVFFPGPGTSAGAVNGELVEKRGVLGARLGAVREKSTVTLSARDLQHPIVSIWNDAGAGDLTSVHLSKAYALAPAAGAHVVLRDSEAAAAVVEKRVGLGVTLEFSTTANTAWTDMPLRPGIFVPLLYRSLGYAISGGDEQRLNIRAGTEWGYRAPNDWIGRDATVHGPDGRVDAGRVELLGGEARVTVAKTNLAGVYQVKGTGDAELKFAAVREPAESETALLTDADISTLRTAAEVISYSPGSNSLSALVRERAGVELWSMLAAVGLTLAAVETVLAWRFSISK